MEFYIDSLEHCILFKGIEKVKIESLIKSIRTNIKEYTPDDMIALEGDSCDNVGIILSGNVEIHKSFSSGKVVTINHFEAGNIFGEALVFSEDHQYPATIISTTASSIMFISRQDIISLMTIDSNVLENFMGVLSNRILMLNQRLSGLTLDTLRKKIANLLLLEYKKQKNLYVTLPYSRKKMAEMINIPRPSLSREMMSMKDDGIIDFYKNRIKIIDLEKLKDILS